jgi:hypothetical protein
MKHSIRLHRISKSINNKTVILRFHYSDSQADGEKELFFSFPLFCESALVDNRSEAFLLALFPICSRRNIHFYSNIAMSESFFQKINAFNTFLSYNSSQYHKIVLSAPTIKDERSAKDWRLASGSLGVDSFHTLYVLDKNHLYRRPTHLVFNNTGSNEEGGMLHTNLLQGRMENTKRFCLENGYGFIFVDSNYKSLFEMRYVYTHLFVNSAIGYMLGNAVSTFYVSSSGDVAKTLEYDGPPGHVDFVIYPFLSSEIMEFVLAEGDFISRFDKMRDLVEYVPAQRHLNVCFDFADNCCRCEKCRRTLMALECLDGMDKFSSCFSPDKYLKNRDYIWADMILDYEKGDVYVKEMWPIFKNKLKFKHRLLALYKKLYKKIRKLHGGVFVTNLLHLKCW